MKNDTNNQQATQNEIGWLAGIIDGEGYLGLRWNLQKHRNKRYAQPQLHIVNTDEEIILKTQYIMRKIGLNPYIRASKGYGKYKKDSYRVQLKNLSKVNNLLKLVVRDLTGNKRERAEIIIKFCDIRLYRHRNCKSGRLLPYTKEELELVEKCQPLMKRGASETTRELDRKNGEIWQIMKNRQIARDQKI